ncbi:MAG: type IIL restriction-modification enzyme MmeI [Streptococcus salivarius]
MINERWHIGGFIQERYDARILRKKHEELDGIVDRAYQQRPFESDEDRLGTLLKLYQEMTTND